MVDWVNGILPEHQIINFTNDWLDGFILCFFVDAFCPKVIPNEEALEKMSALERVKLALETAVMELDIAVTLRASQFISRNADQLQRMAYLTQFMRLQRSYQSPSSPFEVHSSASGEEFTLEQTSMVSNEASLDEANPLNSNITEVDAPTGIVSTHVVEEILVKPEKEDLSTQISSESEDVFASLESNVRKPVAFTRPVQREMTERELELEKEMEEDRAKRDQRKADLDELFAAVELDFDNVLKQIDSIGTESSDTRKDTKNEDHINEVGVLNPSTAQKEKVVELDFDFEFSSDNATSSEVGSRPQSVSPELVREETIVTVNETMVEALIAEREETPSKEENNTEDGEQSEDAETNVHQKEVCVEEDNEEMRQDLDVTSEKNQKDDEKHDGATNKVSQIEEETKQDGTPQDETGEANHTDDEMLQDTASKPEQSHDDKPQDETGEANHTDDEMLRDTASKPEQSHDDKPQDETGEANHTDDEMLQDTASKPEQSHDKPQDETSEANHTDDEMLQDTASKPEQSHDNKPQDETGKADHTEDEMSQEMPDEVIIQTGNEAPQGTVNQLEQDSQLVKETRVVEECQRIEHSTLDEIGIVDRQKTPTADHEEGKESIKEGSKESEEGSDNIDSRGTVEDCTHEDEIGIDIQEAPPEQAFIDSDDHKKREGSQPILDEENIPRQVTVSHESNVMSQISTTTSPEPVSEHSSTPLSYSPSASPAPLEISDQDIEGNKSHLPNTKTVPPESPLCNPQCCKVSGRGLYYGIVNQPGDFFVDCSQAGQARLEVVIESPQGDRLDADGEQLKDSVFRIQFTPTQVGTHKISVTFHNTDVPNSPFSCEVSDPSKCTVIGDGLSSCITGKDTRFQVVTSKAGPGTLQTTFIGSNHPTDFQLTSCIEGVYTYHYVTPKAGEYEIDIKWEGHHIPGSPFKFMAEDEVCPDPTACIILHQPLENVKVREEICVVVDCQNAGKGELKALLQSPRGEVACQVTLDEDIYTITTRPSEIGNHSLVLQFAGYLIPDSPINFHVNDPSLVRLSIQHGITQSLSVNKLFMFHANTEKCGDGLLSATATTSDAPNRPINLKVEQDLSGCSYTIMYTPSILGIHAIQLYYDNKPCLATPINLKVCDINSLQDIVLTKSLPARGTQHLLNKQLNFQLSAPNKDQADIKFTAIGVRTGQTPILSIVPTVQDNYSLEFKATKPDDYKISVTYKGEHVQGSPFTIPILPPIRANKVTMYDPVIPLSADKPIELVFDTSQAGSGVLKASVLNLKKKSMPVYVEQVNDHIYRVAFIPKESNTFMVTVLYADKHIGGSPFRVLYQEQTNEPPVSIQFQPDMEIKGLMGAAVYGRNSGRQEATVVQYERGKYQISFQPLTPDTFDLHVYWFDVEIEGSPFEIDFLGMDNESSDALVDSVPIVAGDQVGMLTATAAGHENGPVPIKITPLDNHLCNIEFTSQGKDIFDLNVFWNGKLLSGMPVALPLD